MTNQEIKLWRDAMDMTQEQAAAALGVTKRGYQLYEAGHRPDGRPVVIPRSIALACAAIQAGLDPL
jgi:DNA-binding XRE family transcriptional regulator